jgi:proteasome lid subunit RPN8/RPN11
VNQGTPAEIRIGRQQLTLLDRLLSAVEPQEGCALLLGQVEAGAIWSLGRIWPCLNVWQPALERTRRFCIDPREQLLAQKWARGRGLRLLGSAHSHPDGAAVPSTTDLELTLGPTLMLILGRGGGRTDQTGGPAGRPGWELGCWWLPDRLEPGSAPLRRLAWRMDP